MGNYVYRLSKTLALALVSLTLIPGIVLADDVYVAKILCFENTADGNFILSGHYRTVVNIYNPNPFTVQILKKASRAALERNDWDPAVDQSSTQTHSLRPMQTMAVDCRDVRLLFVPPPGGAFFDGMLEVRVPAPAGAGAPQLIVKRVTAAEKRPGTGNDVETIDIDRVYPITVESGDPG